MIEMQKSFVDIDDAIWMIEQELSYVIPEGKMGAEIIYVDGRWRVTVWKEPE